MKCEKFSRRRNQGWVLAVSGRIWPRLRAVVGIIRHSEQFRDANLQCTLQCRNGNLRIDCSWHVERYETTARGRVETATGRVIGAFHRMDNNHGDGRNNNSCGSNSPKLKTPAELSNGTPPGRRRSRGSRNLSRYFGRSYSPSPLQLHPSPEGEQCQVPFPLIPLSLPVPSAKLHVPLALAGLPSFNVVVPW